jgi:mannitol-specific phosphotransferase system IIBC component
MNNMIEEKQKNTYDIYVNKFKTAFYGFFLFITLSLPVAYKIIDMIAKIISNNIEIYDLHLEEPTPLGRIVMGLIFFILIFIL